MAQQDGAAVHPRADPGPGQSPEQRNFRYEAMLYPGGRGHNHWRQGSSIPDISQQETKLWFYFLAASYIDVGCEAIHFGQAQIMDGNDPEHRHWSELLGKALVPQVAYENADGSPLMMDTDYFGAKRDATRPSAGPFEDREEYLVVGDVDLGGARRDLDAGEEVLRVPGRRREIQVDPLARLQDDHVAAGRLWRPLDEQLAEVQRGGPGSPDQQAIGALVEQFLGHRKAEEESLLAIVESVLQPDDLAQLADAMAARRGLTWKQLNASPL